MKTKEEVRLKKGFWHWWWNTPFLAVFSFISGFLPALLGLYAYYLVIKKIKKIK